VLEHLPEQNPVRHVFKLQEQLDVLDRFLNSLGTDACLAVGPVFSIARSPDAPPLPAVALLVSTRDPAVSGRELRSIVEFCVGGYAVFAMTQGLPVLPPPRDLSLGDVRASFLDLSPLLKPSAREAIGQVHLCWAINDNVLIIASHLNWLREVLAACRKEGPDLARTLQLSGGKLTPGSANAIVVQSGPISDIGTLWLGYLRRTKPEVFDESWWRDRQPGGGDVRLGITVTLDAPNRRLRVEEVYEGQPSHGHLDVGDFIVGCGNVRFATNDLMSEIRAAIQQRPHARWMDLLIERGGVTRKVRLPLPFIDPVRILQRLIAIGKIAQRAVYYDDQSEPAGPRGFLTVELRTSPKPLFEFSKPVPIGSAKPGVPKSQPSDPAE
jgi:hypothetical protein